MCIKNAWPNYHMVVVEDGTFFATLFNTTYKSVVNVCSSHSDKNTAQQACDFFNTLAEINGMLEPLGANVELVNGEHVIKLNKDNAESIREQLVWGDEDR